MTQTLPERRVQRVRHELHRRDVEVRRVAQLSPGFVAITFGAESLAGFVSASFDDHVKFMFPGADGELVMRDFTPRRFDNARCEVDVEFALHGEGLASDWARAAQPGARATLGGPRGSMIVPTDYAWHLLVGDATALPAMRRRLEELPAAANVIVRAHVAPADRLPLASPAQVDLQWVDSDAALVDAVTQLALPPGEGYVWCAGEAATMAQLRRVLLEERNHPKTAARIAAYWKRGASSHHEELVDVRG